MTKILRILSRASHKAIHNPAEAILLLRMAAWVCALSFAVKLQPLPRALALVTARTRPAAKNSAQETETMLANAIDLLLATDLLCFKPVCWKRAAILHRYLALNGIATRIFFGMRKEAQGTISGHAWLEAEEGPILEAAVPAYTVTYKFPSKDAFDLDLACLN